MKRTEILITKPVYFGLSILEISQIVVFEFWNGCVKLKYGEKQIYVTWIQTVSLYRYKQMDL